MKSKITLLIISIVLLSITVVTSTYAAYFTGLMASVGNMEINMYSDNYTEMSIDGYNFTEKLTKNDVYKAMIAKYNGFTFDEDGNFLDGMVKIEAKDSYIKNEVRKMSLSPVTSTDGKTFSEVAYDGTTEVVSLKRGMYLSFDLYFKSKVDRKFSLCFNTNANNYDLDKQTVKITADDVEMNKSTISHGYSTYDESGNVINHQTTDDNLKVNPADAIRFSTVVGEKAKIYEPNIGLGSVSTKLNSDGLEGKYKTYASRFDENKNAAVTYSKNGGATFESYTYDTKPVTYQEFDSIDALTIVDFEHSGEVAQVGFNFWLEGWDADCFEPIIGRKISVSLSFRGMEDVDYYTINYHNGSEVESIKYLKSNLLENIPISILNQEGRKFMGWYLEDEETEFDFKALEYVGQTKDVYAKWQNI